MKQIFQIVSKNKNKTDDRWRIDFETKFKNTYLSRKNRNNAFNATWLPLYKKNIY